MASLDAVASQCFISYKREDNDDFGGVVDKLRKDIAGRFHAQTGRRLEIFLDRESIGWGEDWRNRIRQSVESATVFLPVITMRYFTSDACLDELLAFHSNAEKLGVTELLLPIVLTGADQINADDSRPEVLLIERLNYLSIEDAWLDGYESPQWNKVIFKMVKNLDKALTGAETRLAAAEQSAVEAAQADNDLDEQGGGDAFELLEIVQEMQPSGEAAMSSLTTFFETANGLMDGDYSQLSPGQQKVRLLELASRLMEPSVQLRENAAKFENQVTNVDTQLRGLVGELQQINHAIAQDQLNAILASFGSGQGNREILEQADEMVAMLKMLSLMNVNLKKATAPAIRGLRSLRSAIATVDSWEALGQTPPAVALLT